MKIAVMGAGALGGYFGGRLAAAGHQVVLIARGAHLRALQKDGLRILSPKGDLYLPDIDATNDPGTIGRVDVVMFMVKNGDVEDAAHAIGPMIGPDTMVVTCQNGISAPDRLADIIGASHVVPGVARMPADIPSPGVIRHSAPQDILSFAERDGAVTTRCIAFRDALVAAGTTARMPENIVHDLWAKFIVQSALSSLTTLTRLDIGPLRDNAATRSLFLDAITEADAVGRAVIPDLPEGIVRTSWEFLQNFPPTMHASMLDDLNRGKPLEVDYLSGDVVAYGRRHGVPTPIHGLFHALLQPFAAGTAG